MFSICHHWSHHVVFSLLRPPSAICLIHHTITAWFPSQPRVHPQICAKSQLSYPNTCPLMQNFGWCNSIELVSFLVMLHQSSCSPDSDDLMEYTLLLAITSTASTVTFIFSALIPRILASFLMNCAIHLVSRHAWSSCPLRTIKFHQCW